MPYDTAQINDLIRHRRSTWPAQFDTEKKVERGIVEQMLENANWAPNHGHTEPWRFQVFTGEGLKRLAEFQARVYTETTAPETFQQSKCDKLMNNPLRASYVIAIIMHRGDKPNIPEVEEICATACAVQNMYLTAAAYGIGCYWSTGGTTYKETARSYFNLRPEDRLMGFFYVGHIAKPSADGRRKPIADKVVWVGE